MVAGIHARDLVVAGAVALICGPVASPALATVYSFEAPDAGPFNSFSGWFEATDANGDNLITSDEVSAYSALATGGSSGGPGSYSISTDGPGQTFFGLRYGLGATIGKAADEFLSFGFRRSVTCQNSPDPGDILTLSVEGSASLSGATIPNIGSGSFPGACPSMSSNETRYSIFAAVTPAPGTSLPTSPHAELPSTVPVPLSAILLATGIGALAFRRKRARS